MVQRFGIERKATMVIADEVDVTRTPVDDMPGWVRVRNKVTDGYHYTSPDGRFVSAREFRELKKKYGPNVPEGAIVGATTPKAGFINANQEGATRPIVHPERTPIPPPNQATVEQARGVTPEQVRQQQQMQQENREPSAMDTIVEIADKIPDPKNPSTRTKASGVSDLDVAMGIVSGLIFLSSVVGLLLSIPELTMTPLEATAFAEPLFNIAKKHGWITAPVARFIAEGNDVSQLGKAAVGYGSRIAPAIGAKIALWRADAAYKRAQANQMNRSNMAPRQHQPAPEPPVQSNGHAPVQPGTVAPNIPFRRTGGPPGVIQ
jgi:hypothetical protein